MTLSQIFSKLNTLDAEMQLYRDKGAWRDNDERWGCTITLSNEGAELKVRAVGPSGDEALFNAFDKLDPMINAAPLAKALNLGLLAAPVDA